MHVLDPDTLDLHGAAVIEASAGTGKTYTITSLFLRLLLEEELAVDQILVVTYTRAATAELRDRIRQRLAIALRCARDERVDDPFVEGLVRRVSARAGREHVQRCFERALLGIDEAPVLTIHGFCQRVLRDHAFESGIPFQVELTAHPAPLLERIVHDYVTKELFATDLLRAEALLDEPSKLTKIAARTAGAQGLRVIPEHVERSPFELDAWHFAYERCRAAWSSERDTILQRVRTIPRAGQYLERWAEAMDALFETAALGFSGDDKLKTGFTYFTRSGIATRAKGAPPSHDFFDEAEQLWQLDQRFLAHTQSERLAFERSFVEYVVRELERHTREHEVRTFDALLTDLDQALSGPRGSLLTRSLEQRYRAALVDEFQDTDPLQYRIFKRIFSGERTPLLLIGDPKQAIYAFRGADVLAYMAARGDVGDRVYTLDTNRRSDPALIQALNSLYATVSSPFAQEGIAYLPVRAPDGLQDRLRDPERRAPVELLLVPDGTKGDLKREIASLVAADICALLASASQRHDPDHSSGPRFRKLCPADIAVLCRTNREALEVQGALSQRGVPSVFQGDASVFDSEDATELERALLSLARPADARALRSFLCSMYGGASAEELARLEHDDARWDQLRATLKRLHDTWLEHGFMQAVRGLIHAFDVEKRLLERPDGTRRVTNLWHLCELLAEASVLERLGPLGLLRWFELARSDASARAELVGDAHELRLESSDNAVKLTTVHKSKGLEYPIVYCPFLWEGKLLRGDDKELVRFHDPSAEMALTLDLGTADKPEHVKLAEREALSEGLRLRYVALTRAKHRVCVAVPCDPKQSGSALMYTLFGGGDPEALARDVQAMGAVGISSELTRRAEQSAQHWALRPLERRSELRYTQPDQTAQLLDARPIKRTLDQRVRVSSFSSLISHERGAYAEAGVDHDATAVRADAPIAVPCPLALDPFPKGSVAGQLVHEVLEDCDFCGSEEALRALASSVIAARGYPSELVDVLVRGLLEVFETPLDEPGLSLSRVPTGARLNEMEFMFPVRNALTPRSLERVFRAARAPSALPAYAGELKTLGFDALRGFLRGYIDLVFVHEGRFYVVDYKSNHLGPLPDDYGQAALNQAMAEHHYYLQYHLYGLAVHRYLAQRVRGYDYEQHFGGVYYLFLRGMAKRHAFRTGVYFDRPPKALIEALDALMEPRSEGEVSP